MRRLKSITVVAEAVSAVGAGARRGERLYIQLSLARAGGLGAAVTTRGTNPRPRGIGKGGREVVGKFSPIEERAGHFARQLETIGPGKVIAVQIGNHRDWPSLFLACLRKQVVVLPLEQTISEEQK